MSILLAKTYLLVVNAHSKWPKIMEMTSITTQKTITELCKMFAAYELLAQPVSDNRPQFTAEEFTSFMQANSIKHIRCTPYHLACNGAVERLVQMFMKTMKSYIQRCFQ